MDYLFLAQHAATTLTLKDWMGIIGMVIGQTVALGGLLWRIATRAAKMETALTFIQEKLLKDHDERINRLEQRFFDRQ